MLEAEPEIDLTAALPSLTLRVVTEPPTKHLVRSDDGVVSWSCTPEEWSTIGELLEPLLTQRGHQYLTSETLDDALVEFSHGEGHLA